jgi:hypothetical protein
VHSNDSLSKQLTGTDRALRCVVIATLPDLSRAVAGFWMIGNGSRQSHVLPWQDLHPDDQRIGWVVIHNA